MYIFNLYEDCNLHKASVASSSDLNNALASIKNIVSLYLNEWYKEKEFATFRIEVIDQETNDIRNIIWESKQGFFEACSIEKYINHLINKETYQVWIKDYVDDEGICKFAD